MHDRLSPRKKLGFGSEGKTDRSPAIYLVFHTGLHCTPSLKCHLAHGKVQSLFEHGCYRTALHKKRTWQELTTGDTKMTLSVPKFFMSI